MADIIISEFMDEAPIERLRTAYTVYRNDELWSRRTELDALIPDAKAIIVRNRTQIDASLIAKAAQLRVVGRLGVGLDNIDLDACKTKDITVCPAVGANAEAVAEYVLAASLVLLRWAAFADSVRVKRAEWPREEMGKGREAAGKIMGLIGYGSIGQATARKARALGFRTIAFDTLLAEADPAWKDAERTDLSNLLSCADIVSAHCPLTPETRGLIGAPELAAMKAGAILINTARGGIVEEAPLAAALRSGHLAGAALDVLETEPITASTAALFAGISNIILTPHIAGVTVESNSRISTVTVENVLKILEERGS